MNNEERFRKFINIIEQNIDIEDCFNFLGCNKFDTLEDIRGIFYGKLHFFMHQYSNIINYYQNISLNDNKIELEYELQENALYHRLVADCYLVILLYKTKNDSYIYIIQGISAFFVSNLWQKNKIYPILDDVIKDNYKEIYLYPSVKYFEDLYYNNKFGTKEGLYKYTSSLMSIILLEKDIIKPNETVKVLTINNLEYAKNIIKYKKNN